MLNLNAVTPDEIRRQIKELKASRDQAVSNANALGGQIYVLEWLLSDVEVKAGDGVDVSPQA